jgi:MATE family multidrug resistance protein
MIRVGYFLGKKDLPSIRKAGHSVFVLVILLMIISGIIFVVGSKLLPTFYSSNAQVISLASSLLLIAALFQLSDGVQAVGLGVLRGLKDVKVPTFLTFIAYWIIALPLGYLLGIRAKMGPIGVWIGLFVGLTIAALALFSRFSLKSKKIIQE